MSAVRLDRMLIDGVYYRLLEDCPPLRPLARGAAQAGAFALAAGWRRNLLANAGLALGPGATRAARTRCAYRMLGAMQRFIGEVLASRRASADELRARVTRFEGTAEYIEARKLGRGVVIAGIHMGSFEPALAMLRGLEKRVHVLYHPDAMPRFERARSELRARLGVVEHRVSEGLAAWSGLLDALKADEAVVIHADRTMPGQLGVRMPLLGLADAELPPGPLRLASTIGSPIVPTFCARVQGGLHIWADGWIETRAERLTAAEVATHPAQLALVAAMERAIRRYPDQWMAFADLRGTREARA
jgi:lauroyl/myristoyl acyltransferase